MLHVPDMVNDEAGGGDEEVLHPVEVPAHRLRVDGVMGDSSTGLMDHLEEWQHRSRWVFNMTLMNTLRPDCSSSFQLFRFIHPNKRE